MAALASVPPPGCSSSFSPFSSKSRLDASSLPSPLPSGDEDETILHSFVANRWTLKSLAVALISIFLLLLFFQPNKARAVAKLSVAIDGDPTGAEQFLENNSILAFMRFTRGHGDDGRRPKEVSVVVARSFSPQVDLVSTIFTLQTNRKLAWLRFIFIF
uniref:Uncharacterized protein LOC105047507 n=1 Tax=Elaeis guineensis var. tenera TaxID=51953 RepID=A0A6I9REM1_ELAGV|nr:uncharacterized protein LOC105047507 [Elaeis guineensis]